MGRQRLIAMQCGERGLGHLSLVFGLLAVGTLSLAVATDFWLFTTEELDPKAMDDAMNGSQTPAQLQPPPLGSTADAVSDNDDADDLPSSSSSSSSHSSDVVDYYYQVPDVNVTSKLQEDVPDDGVDYMPPGTFPIVVAKMHSGLWRSCMYNDDQDAEMSRPVCTNIEYFGQDSERPDFADTTNSLLRAIRKSSPVIVGSLVVMVTALTFSIVGSSKHDVKTLIAAILYIFGALSLAVGVIFYISAVNDEVSHRKKVPSSAAGVSFSYRYGWAFFFAGASFMCAMVAAVNSISLYLRRGIDVPGDGEDGRTLAVGDGAGEAAMEKQQLQQKVDWRHQPMHTANVTTTPV